VEDITDREGDEASSRGGQLVRDLFVRFRVPRRSRSKVVEEVLKLSYHAAHRRVIGTIPWAIEEIEALAEHFGSSLAELVVGEHLRAVQDGECLVGKHRVACRFVFGPEADQTSTLVAVEEAGGWLVLCRAEAEAEAREARAVSEVQMQPAPQKKWGIAVLDDSPEVTESVCSYLGGLGFEACGFTTLASLDASLARDTFDGYILDWLIDTESVARLIRQIRASDQDCPIIVLTGKVRDGAVDAEDIARELAANRAFYFEKPAPTPIIAAQLSQALNHRAKKEGAPGA
jgi:CheY-like chemotaxis protein